MIKNVEREVRSGRGDGKKAVLVGKVDQPKFIKGDGQSLQDVLNEAIEHFGGGDVGLEEILDLVNTQYGTNLINKVRAEVNTKPTKAKLMEMAFNEIAKLPVDQMAAIMGDATKRQQFVDAKVAELEAGWEADKAARLQKLAKEAGDDEGDEQSNA